jgi:hypothetical protein
MDNSGQEWSPTFRQIRRSLHLQGRSQDRQGTLAVVSPLWVMLGGILVALIVGALALGAFQS